MLGESGVYGNDSERVCYRKTLDKAKQKALFILEIIDGSHYKKNIPN